MIVYQLPNGKIVHLTLEQFLNLTDDDESLLSEYNYGYTCSTPFVNIDDIKEEEVVDNDYPNIFDSDDETDTRGPLNINHLLDDE